MSINKSARFAASASTSVSSTVKPGRSRTSSAFATASSASAGSRSAASGIHADAVRDILGDLRHGLERQPRLPCPAGACERQQSNVLAAQQAYDFDELAPAAEKRRRRDGKVRPVQRLQARKVGVAQLEQALGRREVLQTVLTQVANSLAGDEVARRLRQENLPAVPGGSNARRAVNVDADVALLGCDRLARVEPHAHSDRPVAERRLPVGGGRDRIGGARERHEERVALRVDLDAAVPRESLPQHTTVLAQQLRVTHAMLVQQPSRPLDIRKQERHRPRRQVPWHARSIVDDFPLDVSSPSLARSCRTSGRGTPAPRAALAGRASDDRRNCASSKRRVRISSTGPAPHVYSSSPRTYTRRTRGGFSPSSCTWRS